MKKVVREVELKNRLGLHARPSTMIATLASNFKSEIFIERVSDGMRANAKSVFGVMMLAAPKGTVLKIEAEGEDAEEAINALIDLINRGFDED
ncbi:MAG: HPr family phosphocarrier protein [candidate division WOR-3 bacterium]